MLLKQKVWDDGSWMELYSYPREEHEYWIYYNNECIWQGDEYRLAFRTFYYYETGW